MRTSHTLTIGLVTWGAVGCAAGDEPSRSASGSPPTAERAAAPRLRARADSVIANLVAGINRRDAALVAALTAHPGEPPDTAGAREAIDDFRHYFRGRPVRGYAFVRLSGDTVHAGHFQYELVGDSGISKPVVAYYDGRTGHLRAYDEFLIYSGRARWLVGGVVDALRRRDAARLARLFNPDDIDYPVGLAEQVVSRYAQRFDLETLRYRFDGLAPQRPGADDRWRPPRWFRYTLYGSKGGVPVEHRVEIIHGDGLVGWRDSWVPPAPSY